MLGYKRSARVGELVQHEISRIVQELREPGMGFVTVTGIKMTDDLRDARVFFSVMGSQEEIERSCEIVQSSIQEIRHQLAVRLNLRHTPALSFQFDDTPAKAAHIFELLDKISAQDQQEVQPAKIRKSAKKAPIKRSKKRPN